MMRIPVRVNRITNPGMWSRRKMIKNMGFYCGVSIAVECSILGCTRKFSKPEIQTLPVSQTLATSEQIQQLKSNVITTEKYLQDYTNSYRKVKGYLDELNDRTTESSTAFWVEFQNNRLDHIRWVADKYDEGKRTGERLKMRPYDIPWLVWCFGYMSDEKRWIEFMKKSFNGANENCEKVKYSPDVEIEFTNNFADFCYICDKMLADGCSLHPEFGGYGEVFPQPVQISPELREDSNLALQILGLQWNDVVSGKRLMNLCVKKAPDPSKFDKFPLKELNWDDYRLGVSWWKTNMM